MATELPVKAICTVPCTVPQPSDDSCLTSTGAFTPTSAVGINAAAFLTQSVKKQPRSPREQRPDKRPRVLGAGCGNEVEDDTSSTEPAPVEAASTLDEALHQLQQQGMAVTQGGTSVFSPVFHTLQRRPSVDHPQHHSHAEGSGPEAQHGMPDQYPQQWARFDPANHSMYPHSLSLADVGSGVEQQAGNADVGSLALQPLHHHTVIPEAVEHELPPDASAEAEEELDYMDFDPLLFIKLLPPLEQVVPKHRSPLLPRKTRLCKQKTLVLDLDETLVHSCLEAQAVCDFTFPVHFNSQEHMIHVRQRPHLHTFMQRVAELFEVVVFTASQKIYAEKLLNIIDPERKLIKHRIFREACVVVDGNYLKDLTALGRDLRTTLIVDNSPQAFGFQVDNGVPIESWYDDPADTELLKLLPFLEQLAYLDDVRPAIRDRFRMREIIDRVVC